MSVKMEICRTSVVICTHNRSSLLKCCLESLMAQSVSKNIYEVIVVDNNSTDDTKEVAEEYCRKISNFRYFFEEKQGPSQARNRGWLEAKGEYVAFIDDDGKASENWIEVLCGIVEAQSPDIIGGPIYPYYSTQKPGWFKDEYEIRIHQKETGWMNSGFISGSNLIIRRALIEEIGGFDIRYGMSGGQLAYGEDSEIVKRARECGKKIYYSLDLKVSHHVPFYKMDILYAMNSFFRGGNTSHPLWDEFDEVDLAEMVERCFSNLNTAIQTNLSDPNFSRDQYIFENCLKDIYIIGTIVGQRRALQRKRNKSVIYRAVRKISRSIIRIIKKLRKKTTINRHQ